MFRVRSATLLLALVVFIASTAAQQPAGRGDVAGNFVAFDAATGSPLWHARIGQVSNAPQTYLVNGRQHVLVAAGDTLYAFALN